MSRPSPIWHPMTQHGLFPDSLHIEKAQGAYLFTREGRKIIDGISSWWVNTHGHCHPKIVKAVQHQAERLEQVVFAGFTHEPGERLARKLTRLTGRSLEHVFFSDSGSTAVEVALKMAIGYFEHNNANIHPNRRRKIVALDGAYHGDTFGAMSVSGRSVFNKLYEPFLFDVEHLPFPKEGQELQTLEKFSVLLRSGEIAALIVEPLVQGAAGMRMYKPEVLKELYDLCRAREALFIADEVMTGFGRTGTMLACEQAGIAPDLLCLSKGLTGGFLPMGATLATKEIYDAFYYQDRAKMFFHSTSFTGNALACAAALASMDIWDEEPVFDKIKDIETAHKRAAGWFYARPDIASVRVLGSIFAIDIRDSVQGYLSALAPQIHEFMLENDILLRPIGNTVYILPPYCIEHKDLEMMYETLWRSLDSLRNESEQRAA